MGAYNKEPDVYPIPKICPYCGEEVILTTNDKIYGVQKGNGMVYMCINKLCGAHVGVHDGTTIPYGNLANKELRELRKQAHNLFDRLWKSGEISRSDAYFALAFRLGIPPERCHIGQFDKIMIDKAIKAINRML